MFNRYSILFLVLALSACEQRETNTALSSEPLDQDVVLVSVNGEAISENDLESAIVRTLGEYASFQLDEVGQSKVLQSLVLSKAMALTQTSAMEKDELIEVDRMVEAYREEILAKRYLQQNIVALPVSNDMVKNYYDKHPEKFGGKTIKTFEVVKGLTKKSGTARQKMLNAMNNLSERKHWKIEVKELKAQSLQVEYSKGAVAEGVLTSDIDNIINGLALNETSSVHFIKGLPLIARVVAEKKIAPKPLAQVSSDIKKSLAPLQLKRAVKKASVDLLNQVNVVYPEAK